MPLPLVLVALAFVAVCVFFAQRQAKARKAQMDVSWAAAARQLGCTHTSTEGSFLTLGTNQIDGVVGHARIRVDTFVVSQGKSSTTYTRVAAAAANTPHGYRLHVFQEGVLAKLGTMLGGQDITVGHPAFDEAFVVKSNTVDLTRTILRRPLTDAMLDMPEVDFRLEDGSSRAVIVGTLTDTASVVAMARATASLAEAPALALARWNALAATLGGAVGQMDSWTRDGKLPPIEIEPRGVPLRIDPDEENQVRISLADADHAPIDQAALQGTGLDVVTDKNGARHYRVGAQAPEVERALEALSAASVNMRPYRG